ncbi:Short-chain dehydrogenase/reductase SDR [Desulfatibacillum aliphaticivorans]|uniref:Short-chain dehydrogenase/reductase SDR n=1 Tax=Desulfatibacillum aliphaticivorans TaxID=218208 RepID=B8FCV4_DESAL|nr:SDR family NAD(P)-dependent oxidoreductase [Desulfatibacillum aliphaticivorans]ACL06385.1 Short-chain dehydrogenase/reductase SDR [Desulfatibacillum aliphaticivorans]
MDINGKKIILTGASSGIGLDLLQRLTRFDCKIIAVARTIEKVDFDHPNVVKFPCDISDPEKMDELFDFALEQWGNIDIYIANAGFAYYERINNPDWKHIEKIYQTNVFSSFYAAEKMKEINKDRPFRVVVTASAMSFLSLPGYSLYSSTKAAIRGFATAYRFELAKDQKLQLVFPIATRTSFFKEAGSGTPVPWPSQEPEKVSAAIVRGIQKDKDSIFPSSLFNSIRIANGYLPFLYPFIAWFEAQKLYKWESSQK